MNYLDDMKVPVTGNVEKIRKYCEDNDIFYLKSTMILPKEIEYEVQEIYDRGYFVQHRSNTVGDDWLGCTLHGWGTTQPDFKNTRHHTNLSRDQVKYGWTQIQQFAPVTTKFIAENFEISSLRRVRFMLLKPGGSIGAHSDTPSRNIFGSLNCAITQPDNCYLRRADSCQEIPFSPGSIFYFDHSVTHEAKNDSNENRFHLLIYRDQCNKGTDDFEKSFNRLYPDITL